MQKPGGGGGGGHGDGGDIYNVQAAEILAKEALVSPLLSALLYSSHQLNFTQPNPTLSISAAPHQRGRPHLREASRHLPHGCQYTLVDPFHFLIRSAKVPTHNVNAQAKYWKQYVEAYMATNNDEATKQIFSRCLLNCLHISLWSVLNSPTLRTQALSSELTCTNIRSLASTLDH